MVFWINYNSIHNDYKVKNLPKILNSDFMTNYKNGLKWILYIFYTRLKPTINVQYKCYMWRIRPYPIVFLWLYQIFHKDRYYTEDMQVMIFFLYAPPSSPKNNKSYTPKIEYVCEYWVIQNSCIFCICLYLINYQFITPLQSKNLFVYSVYFVYEFSYFLFFYIQNIQINKW